MKIFDTVNRVMVTIGVLVQIAEYTFDGTKQGAEKRAYVVDQASTLLTQEFGAFWSGGTGKMLIGVIIDALVAIAKKLGNL